MLGFQCIRAPYPEVASTDLSPCEHPEVLVPIMLQWACDKFRAARVLEAPLFVLVTPAGLVFASPVGDTYENAKELPALVRGLASAEHAVALYAVSEVWVSSQVVGEPRRTREPRFDPQREEAVLVMLEDPRATPPVHIWSARVDRSKGRPRLQAWVDSTHVRGRLTYLLPPVATRHAGA